MHVTPERAVELSSQDAERERRTARHAPTTSPVMVLLVILATLGILGYGYFLLRPGARGDLLPYVLVLIAEGILVVNALFSMWTILSGGRDPRNYAYFAAQRSLFPPDGSEQSMDGRDVSVDVFITVYGEPLDTIRATAVAAKAIRGRHRTWILDDGKSDEVRDLAHELGVDYIDDSVPEVPRRAT